MDNTVVQKLFQETIGKLGFQNEGYVLTISRRLRENYAYADVWELLTTSVREIVISERHTREDSSSKVLGTILHEIAHFIQHIEVFKKLRFFRRARNMRFYFDGSRVVSYFKRLPTANDRDEPHYMHNDRFIEILEDLENKLEIQP